MSAIFSPLFDDATLALGQSFTITSGIAAGTTLLTQSGIVPVESIAVGDKVITRDRGLQPVRWVGAWQFFNQADAAAVHFAADAMGNHEAITLAPQTRVLIRSAMVKALYRESEVFALAGDLVNGTTICSVQDFAPITMVQMLFDNHEILRANEMEVESLHPDRAFAHQLDEDTKSEIDRILPKTSATARQSLGQTERTCLQRAQSRIFCASR